MREDFNKVIREPARQGGRSVLKGFDKNLDMENSTSKESMSKKYLATGSNKEQTELVSAF